MPKKSIILFFITSFCFTIFNLAIFYPIFTSNNIIISFAIHPFNICDKYPEFWHFFKILYVLTLVVASCSISYMLIKNLVHLPSPGIAQTHQQLTSNLYLTIGYSQNQNQDIILPDKSLYQNILITGTIGSGKTSSAIYPFSEQLIKYQNSNPSKKLGILCLDVKGNFYEQIKFYAKNIIA